jgi:uncharacterized protein (DUF849 family)
MKSKCIINCAITGSIHVPSQTPYLPITPEQLVSESIAAVEAGAATVHLHARNPEDGCPTMDLGLFKEFCGEINQKSDGVICITTGGSITMTPEERMVAVQKIPARAGLHEHGLHQLRAVPHERPHQGIQIRVGGSPTWRPPGI